MSRSDAKVSEILDVRSSAHQGCTPKDGTIANELSLIALCCSMSCKPCQNVPVRRTIGRYDDSCGERCCDPRENSFEGRAWSLQVECRTVDPAYQHDIRDNDSQKSVCLATALPEVLEQIPKDEDVGDFEQVRTLAKIRGEYRREAS